MTLKSYRAGSLASLVLGGLAAATLLTLPALAQAPAAPPPTLDKADNAWMMISTVLVLLMIVPGLALFYGGLVRAKNMLSVLTQVLAGCCLMMIVWVVYGYSLAFGEGNAFIGSFAKAFLGGVTKESLNATMPEYVFIGFQMTFAAITPALAIGAFAERTKFAAVMLFVLLWSTFVYFPIAHMVWQADGYLMKLGALDFAGGTVVHINAGIAGLVGCLMVGKRIGFGRDLMAPHSLPMTMVGGTLLWVGWFGFNAGSAAAANDVAGLALIN
ncbi:MAG: ammonium transporter, partial [Rhizobiales bacterium]|nr:ammonium transporter [Hyphomicrobiales bacterium]